MGFLRTSRSWAFVLFYGIALFSACSENPQSKPTISGGNGWTPTSNPIRNFTSTDSYCAAYPSPPTLPSSCTTANNCKIISTCNNWDTSRFYYLPAALSTSCTLTPPDNVTIYGPDGQQTKISSSGTGSVTIGSHFGVVLMNLDSTGGISISNGNQNQIINSKFAGGLNISNIASGGSTYVYNQNYNVFRDSSFADGMYIGDGKQEEGTQIDPTPYTYSECNYFENNTFQKSFYAGNVRYLKFQHVSHNQFVHNTFSIPEATDISGDPSTDGQKVILLFTQYTHYNQFIGNSFNINYLPGSDTTYMIMMREGSSHNLFQFNDFISNGLTFDFASGHGVPYSHDNTFVSNLIKGDAYVMDFEATGPGTTRLENNVFVASGSPALYVREVPSGATVEIIHNTVVSTGTTVTSDSGDTGRQAYLRDNILYSSSGTALDIKMYMLDSDYNDYKGSINNSATWWDDPVYSGGGGVDAHTLHLDPVFAACVYSNYCLSSSSPLKLMASDGNDIGAIAPYGRAGYLAGPLPTPTPTLTPTPLPGANQSPSVTITALSGSQGLVMFTVSASDPDGSAVNCILDFGDGSQAVACGSSVPNTYTPGTYHACATATDNLGASSTACQDLKISPQLHVRILSSNNGTNAPINNSITIQSVDSATNQPLSTHMLFNGQDVVASETSVDLASGEKILVTISSANESLYFTLARTADGTLFIESANDLSAIEIVGVADTNLATTTLQNASSEASTGSVSDFFGNNGCSARSEKFPFVSFTVLSLFTLLRFRKAKMPVRKAYKSLQR